MKNLNNFIIENTRPRGKTQKSYGTFLIFCDLSSSGFKGLPYKITSKEFYKIINEMNTAIAEEILNNKEVKLPHKMGTLTLLKSEGGAFLKDGKLKYRGTVNWRETWKLWYTDEESRKEKRLIMNESKVIFKIGITSRWFTNKIFYVFTPMRSLKRRLKDKIINNQVDAFNL